jgi:hypothetical protein
MGHPLDGQIGRFPDDAVDDGDQRVETLVGVSLSVAELDVISIRRAIKPSIRGCPA